MRKVLVIVLSMVLVFSCSLTAFAADNGKGNGKDAKDGVIVEEGTEETGAALDNQGKKAENALKKAFKAELNQAKKELQQQKSSLEAELEAMQAEYDALIAAGDTTGAEAVLTAMAELTDQLSALQSQIKQAINERYMIVKTMYNAEELAQFDSAADLIAQMYADAAVLGAGSITINNNIIKLDAPAYIKGGRIIIPVRAVTEQLGAEVTWDEETQTVTVTKDNTTIVFGINSTAVTVNGTAIELDAAAAINCGRTYVPLRFLAETFGLTAAWDEENQIVDIDGDTDDTGSGSEDETEV